MANAIYKSGILSEILKSHFKEKRAMDPIFSLK